LEYSRRQTLEANFYLLENMSKQTDSILTAHFGAKVHRMIGFLVLSVLFSQTAIGQDLASSSQLQVVEGVVVVKYKTPEFRNWILATANSPNSELFSFKLAAEEDLIENIEETKSLVKVSFDSNTDPRKLARVLSKYPFVEYAEPKRIYPKREQL